MAEIKKLIEVSMPLEAINSASSREKSIRHGHPSTLHLWWARRPLAAARAVIWASLVDDPSSHPDKFPTQEAQEAERKRLFGVLEKLVVWENSNEKNTLDAAKAEIAASMGSDLPPLLDPFAGGGAIPLEAQRLGLEAYAQDLNPVAVTIEKAMIEIPPKFSGLPPVGPGLKGQRTMWDGSDGLAADVEYYGNWMREEAFKAIGYLYPQVDVPKGNGVDKATVIAWLWARTVACPNPACGAEAPLVRSFDLSKKKGKEWHVEATSCDGHVHFETKPGKSPVEGTVNRRGATCLHCGSPIDLRYVKEESKRIGLGAQLMAVVAEGQRGRIYISPDDAQVRAAQVPKPEDCPTGDLAKHFTGGSCVPYGLDTFDKLFTNRQLTALTTFSDLVAEAQAKATQDALASGMASDGVGLDAGGTGATAYGQAVGVYLAFLVDKLADYHSSICTWNAPGEKLRNTFGRQAIPMAWDYTEANPFSNSSGSYNNMLTWVFKSIKDLPKLDVPQGHARQFDAQSDNGMRNIMVSTDPPYYDNIGYADLSDFFYVWLRRSLRKTYPKLFSTVLVPKVEELVATPYRESRGVQGARDFFEEGMLHTFEQVHEYTREDIPVTVYYAFKQSETTTTNEAETTASTGWETMLSALIHAGFAITGTWPLRTEMGVRMISIGTNALASSIVLVCRKRPEDATLGTRREFVQALRRELPPALDKLQTSNIAPVDLAQSAIGPGMGVYSRYTQVLEADGTPMTVRAALQLINQELDAYFAGQDGESDANTRLCLELYKQAGFGDLKFGEADILARAKNTSIQSLTANGAVSAVRGTVHLVPREELGSQVADAGLFTWKFTQQLTHAMETGGIVASALLMAPYLGNATEQARALAYHLYTIAERKGWQKEAFAYNALVVAWPDISARATELAKQLAQETLTQGRLNLSETN